jgi:hypothetical protein
MSADNIPESALNRLMTDQGNNHAVLYVDSCESSLRAFRLVCSDQFRVLTASSGLEGLAQLNEHKDEIGVVVVARCMPIRRGTWLLASDGCCLMEEEASLRDGVAKGIIAIPWEPAELKKRLRLELERFAFQQRGQEDSPA